MDNVIIEQELQQLLEKHNQLFGELHQAAGAISVLKYLLASDNDAKKTPDVVQE